MNATEWETLIQTRQALLSAGRGDKARVVQAACQVLGCSVATLYRKLEAAGLDTQRKRRADAGATAMSLAELQLVSGLLFHSRRQNDKQLLTVEDALEMLAASGQLKTKLSPGRVLQLLRENSLHPEQLAQQTPAIELRSLHPNHVWQLDASTCVLYYMRSGHLAAMDADQFYKNKPQNMARVLHDLCTRFAVADHTSGAFKARYFLGSESAQNLVDFFIWAVTKQDSSPMHGAPRIVMLDPGAANKGHLFRNLCKRMGVELVINEVGNARAKGAVEKTHDIIERHFEGRFRFLPAEELTLDRINELCEQWAAGFNASRKHSRHGEPRYSVWMRITPEQLRVPASADVLRELVAHEPEQRRVSNTKTITFAPKGYGQQTYDVSLVPGVAVGGRVTVQLNAYRSPAIDVMVTDQDTGECSWLTVAPLERDANGFRTDAPVIGQEIRRAAFTDADHQRNAITQQAYRQPGERLPSLEDAAKARKRHEQAYAGLVDAMADVMATPVPAYLPRRGTVLDVGPTREVAPVVLGVVDACKRLKAELGEAYTPQVFGWVSQRYPEGVPEAELAQICAQFAQPVAAERPAGLRVVGGAL